ncbi:SUMF1/EgtB/PvdO family nonheme iron enzyme [Candidatus Thiosymbion oneisti]|uniref:SUMF1/EgtB/PvdO family nonheme iron enzyme n=1 Tax=Candidatus Thiosymbion oneisti TaxID=589554 RepID=UPI000B7F6843|nr:SUMF1/EgtB/PvdO family nonheme iron enzyme [Candidatus Thiosymbion oneisti]
MADIFISYSQQDRRRVKPLVDALTAEGYEVWWDLKICAGESFDELIESTLEKVRCVVTVWSQHSVTSEWVRAESAWAKDQGKFVSIRIDGDIKLPLKFYNVHTRSLVGWTGTRDSAAFRDLLAGIAKIGGPPPTPEPDLPSTLDPEPIPHILQEPPADTPKTAESPSPSSDPSPPPGPGSATNAPKQPVSTRRWIGIAGLAVIGTLVGGIVLFGPGDKPVPSGTAPTSSRTETPAPLVSPASEPEKNSFVPLSVFHDTLKDGSQGPAMVVIPGGSFWMGSPASETGYGGDEGPVHGVTLRRFAMGQTEVTFDQYERFAMATGRKRPDDAGWGRGQRPVIDVSWQDATAYAAWLSDQTGQSYRLPTEAEWEYAARAGTSTLFWTGDCIHTDQANYNGNEDYNGCGAKTGMWQGQTVPAGSLPANPWGLHETAGNVYEWTQDCWHKNYQGAPSDGSAWGQGNGGNCAGRVVRGGGWDFPPQFLRSAFRYWLTSDGADDILGIRLARAL